VVGLILEAATRRSVHALVQERILTPLGLSGTTFPAHDRDIAGYHAHGYRPPDGAGTGWQDVTLLAPSLLWTAGGIISTATDLRRFYGALLGGELLPAAQQAQLLTAIAVNPVFGYGLGIETLRGPCGQVWGHSGGVPGYITLAYNSRDGRRGLVLMLSTEPDEDLIALLRLTVDTAVCQMFDRVPPDLAARPGRSAGWAPGWGVRPVQ
jgi:D-alanyl-D-alanine carboxypeptidase